MNIHENFERFFELLTGNARFPWQRALFDELVEKQFRKSCDIPTGLGKTSIMALWLLALAHHAHVHTLAGFPRRLVYVVNRRTVVDQATREAERLRETLSTKTELKEVDDLLRSLCVQNDSVPLAISTLRGQFADNQEWRNDPARPAVIVGTVDMIGSRLLFSGYGCGFKSKPLHAGFLGQDALLVHDEAHLEPAFQKLVTAIEKEQGRCHDFSRLHIMALTATSRSSNDGEKPLFTEADRKHKVVKSRFEAKKGIAFYPVDDEKKIAEEVVQRALEEYKDSGKAILVFLRRLDDVKKVGERLQKGKQRVQMLAGTLRGLERDDLAKNDPVFARFMPKPQIEPAQGTVYLVCTSAGEVGVDISADYMVCDLTPFDSMAQRFGRVNRYGNGEALIDVVYALNKQKENNKELSPFDSACDLTLSLLHKLPLCKEECRDASPAALRDLPEAERLSAFTPPPVILPANDILFDAWALTSIRDRMPGRPPVAEWLHGVAEWEPPDTHVAWREEVEILTEDLLGRYKPEDLLEDYPLKPHEVLRDQTERVFKQLEAVAKRCPDLPTWVIDRDGEVRTLLLREFVEDKKKPVVNLEYCTVLLPPKAGGLGFNHEGRPTGMLNGDVPFDEAKRSSYDVSGHRLDENQTPLRCRVWNDDPPINGMRLVRTIETRPNDDDVPEEDVQASSRYWRWYVRPRSADDDGSRTAREAQELGPHLQLVEHVASLLVDRLGLKDPEAKAVVLAARWHDLGKHRRAWQWSIGNLNYPQRVLAKSGPGMRSIEVTEYRHEFGSLIEVKSLPEFGALDADSQDLILHLIAVHHGRARPHFPIDEAFDPEHPEDIAAEVAREVPRRFARLQRKYGRWGLAYIESLVRAADVLASQARGPEIGNSIPAFPQEVVR